MPNQGFGVARLLCVATAGADELITTEWLVGADGAIQIEPKDTTAQIELKLTGKTPEDLFEAAMAPPK